MPSFLNGGSIVGVQISMNSVDTSNKYIVTVGCHPRIIKLKESPHIEKTAYFLPSTNERLAPAGFFISCAWPKILPMPIMVLGKRSWRIRITFPSSNSFGSHFVSAEKKLFHMFKPEKVETTWTLLNCNHANERVFRVSVFQLILQICIFAGNLQGRIVFCYQAEIGNELHWISLSKKCGRRLIAFSILAYWIFAAFCCMLGFLVRAKTSLLGYTQSFQFFGVKCFWRRLGSWFLKKPLLVV